MPRRKRLPTLFALALTAGLLRVAGRPAMAEAAASFQATVLSVGDGDTLRVRAGDHTTIIRLACIDAPETAQSPWGLQSKTYLAQRLPRGRKVMILPQGQDRYGRTVAELISDININLVMVEDGQAFVDRRHLHGCGAKDYLEAEHRASRHRHGVWRVEGGITRPWVFRRDQRAMLIPDGAPPGGRRWRCREIGSHDRARDLLRQGHSNLDGDGDGKACESPGP
jgi:endonuclease YncB( thermonuclease family)